MTLYFRQSGKEALAPLREIKDECGKRSEIRVPKSCEASTQTEQSPSVGISVQVC